jgi:hypothetical protein
VLHRKISLNTTIWLLLKYSLPTSEKNSKIPRVDPKIRPFLEIFGHFLHLYKFSFIGVGVMTPLSWLPTANATMTLYCVKAYRRFVIQLFNCCCGVKSAQIMPTTTMSEHSKQPTVSEFVD